MGLGGGRGGVISCTPNQGVMIIACEAGCFSFPIKGFGLRIRVFSFRIRVFGFSEWVVILLLKFIWPSKLGLGV